MGTVLLAIFGIYVLVFGTAQIVDERERGGEREVSK